MGKSQIVCHFHQTRQYRANRDHVRNVAYSLETVDDSLFKQISSGKIPFIIFGHFEYTDMYAGKPTLTYSTEFCEIGVGNSITNAAVPNQALENGICLEHNGIK